MTDKDSCGRFLRNALPTFASRPVKVNGESGKIGTSQAAAA